MYIFIVSILLKNFVPKNEFRTVSLAINFIIDLTLTTDQNKKNPSLRMDTFIYFYFNLFLLENLLLLVFNFTDV